MEPLIYFWQMLAQGFAPAAKGFPWRVWFACCYLSAGLGASGLERDQL